MAPLTKPPSFFTSFVLRLFAAFRLVELTYSKDGKNIIACTNLTLICMVLCIFGPMKENSLTKTLLAVQAGGSVLAFTIRYAGSGLFYDQSRR